MLSFELTEPSFDKKKTTDYKLSVLLRTDSLSYCVNDKSGTVLSVVKMDLPEADEGESYADRLEKVILRDVILQQSFGEVVVAVATGRSTLIPERLYNSEEKSVYLEKMLPLTDELRVCEEVIADFAVRNIYAFPDNVLRVLQTYFSGGHIYHIATVILSSTDFRQLNEDPQKLLVNVHQEALQILFFDEGNLVFSNSFPYSSSKDFIYYVMLVFDRFNLKPEDVPVYLSGEVLEDSEIYHLIYRYVKHLRIVNAPSSVKLSERWKDRPQHWFFDLFCLASFRAK